MVAEKMMGPDEEASAGTSLRMERDQLGHAVVACLLDLKKDMVQEMAARSAGVMGNDARYYLSTTRHLALENVQN